MSKSETIASASPAPSSSMPSEDEIIRAFEVPSHREEEVRAAYAAYLESVDADDRQKGRQPDSLLSSFYVPPSRTHCATADRIRSLGQPLYYAEDEPGLPTGSAAATLISRGRWRMLLDELGTGGVVGIASALRNAPRSIETLGEHTLAVALLDLVTEPNADPEDCDASHVDDEAAGWTIWLSTVLSQEELDPVDEDDLLVLEQMFSASGIDLREASAMMTAALALVDAHGPYKAPERGHEAAIAHVWSQITMHEILDHALADPAATERNQELMDQRRAERAAMRDYRASRRSAASPVEMPTLPGLSITV